MKYRSFAAVVALIASSLLLVACASTTDPVRVDGSSAEITEASNETAAPETFSVGETVAMGDLKFTVNSVHFNKGSEFMKPEKGERWLVVDCTLENKGADSAAVSSLMMFKLMDSEDYSREIAIGAETKGSLDGELAAGTKMRGQIAFAVDSEQDAWTLIFEPSLFGFGQARYEIDAKDAKKK